MALDIEGLLAEVTPEEPCGADLQYDPAYYQLMRDAEGTPEQVMGDSVIEAQEPDWRAVKSQAIDLFSRTKDLNVAMLLMLSLAVNDGITGLADGLDLLQQLLSRYWEQMYPRLDPEDHNDPTERMNLIGALGAAPGALGDTRRYQARVREMPLCRSKRLGAFSYRDILIARGELDRPANMETAPDLALIEGAFSEVELEELQRDAEAASRALKLAQGIDAWIMEHVGAQHAPDISGFIKLLGSIEKVYEEQLARRGVGPAPEPEPGQPAAAGVSAGAGDPIRGEITSEQDVKVLLAKICQYYELREPSSPIPILLKRAERLVGKNFIELVRDLSPDALSQLKVVAGVDTFEQQ